MTQFSMWLLCYIILCYTVEDDVVRPRDRAVGMHNMSIMSLLATRHTRDNLCVLYAESEIMYIYIYPAKIFRKIVSNLIYLKEVK